MNKIIWKKTIDSTNSYIKAFPLADGDAYACTDQTSGYGRNNRSWRGEKNKMLAISINSDRNRFHNDSISIIPLITANAVLASIEKICQKNNIIKIKWPNDLLFDNKKISGILCEIHDEKIISGIGININKPNNTNLAETACISDINKHASYEHANNYAQEIIESVNTAYGLLSAYNFPKNKDSLLKEIREKSASINRKVKITTKNSLTRYAKVLSIQDDGSLLVCYEDNNEITPVYSADIEHATLQQEL